MKSNEHGKPNIESAVDAGTVLINTDGRRRLTEEIAVVHTYLHTYIHT